MAIGEPLISWRAREPSDVGGSVASSSCSSPPPRGRRRDRRHGLRPVHRHLADDHGPRRHGQGRGRASRVRTGLDPLLWDLSLQSKSMPAIRPGLKRTRRHPTSGPTAARPAPAGSLPPSVRDDDLHTAFETFGVVTDARVVLDRDTGRSRGFGFVTYAHPSEAADARLAMDGAMLDGRTIRVDFAETGDA